MAVSVYKIMMTLNSTKKLLLPATTYGGPEAKKNVYGTKWVRVGKR